MNSSTMIAARPHFRRNGNDLHFFLSERIFHSLSPAEAEIWDRVADGPVSLAMLDEEAVQSLVDAGVLEIISPVGERERRRILVVEPHCDDAALSIGATMWRMRREAEFHLLTMASRSNYTTAFHMHRDYFDRSQITAMRTAEGELFAQHLGGHYHCAGLCEATLRYNDSDWDLGFFNAHEVATAIFNNRRAPEAVLKTWAGRLKEFLKGRKFDEIWLPLGAGTHSDHDLARNAGLRVALEEQPGAILRLYEDVPYGTQFQEHTDRILGSLREAGATLTPWPQNVAEDFAAKLSLLNIFASQFKVASIQEGVERSGAASGGPGPVERLWTLERPPDPVPENDIWIGAPAIAKLKPELRKFCKGAAAERRVAIFAISAAGRWSDDLTDLGKIFSAARFVVYAGPRVCAEFAAHEDARVDLHCLDGRSISWLKAALREISTGHRIIIAGDALAKARILTLLWPTGRKIVCSAMDHLIQGLADIRSSGNSASSMSSHADGRTAPH